MDVDVTQLDTSNKTKSQAKGMSQKEPEGSSFMK